MRGNGDRVGNLFKKFGFEGQLVVLGNHRINSAHQPGPLIWLDYLEKNIIFRLKQTLGMLRSSEASERGREETRKTRFRLRIECYLFARHCSDPFTFIVSFSSHNDPRSLFPECPSFCR